MSEKAISCLSIIGMAAAFFFVGTWFCQYLWNTTMPIFGLPKLSFWEMFRLAFICKLLFDSTSARGGSKS